MLVRRIITSLFQTPSLWPVLPARHSTGVIGRSRTFQPGYFARFLTARGLAAFLASTPAIILRYLMMPMLLTGIAAGSVLAKPKPPFTVLVKANDIVYSPLTDRIYAAVASDAAEFADSVAVIQSKPKKVIVVDSIPIGKGPTRLALSEDGRYLYVAIGGPRLRRIDLTSSRVDQDFAVDMGASCTLFVADIRVMPGHPESVAVSVLCLGGGTTVGVFDNGIRRPNIVTPELIYNVNELCFSSPDTLWGYNSVGSGNELWHLNLDEQGLSVVGNPAKDLLRAGFLELRARNGLMYSRIGRVVDLEKRTLDGWFLDTVAQIAHSYDIDFEAGKIYFASRDGFDLFLGASDLKTYRPTNFYTGYYGTVGSVNKLIRCGAGGLAIMTDYPRPGVVVYPLSMLQPLPEYTPPRPAPLDNTVRRIPLPNYAIAYDSYRRVFYASVPSAVGNIGNSIVTVDPITGAVGEAKWVGSEPWQLAISDGGRYLYVALFGGRSVQRLRLPEMTPDLRFPLFVERELFYAEPVSTRVSDIVAMPGRPESVIVALGDYHDHSTLESDGVAVYDDGVRRPLVTPAWPHDPFIDSIQVSASGQSVYGLWDGYDYPVFSRMAVDTSGARVTSMGGIQDYLGFSMRCQNGICITNRGLMIDAELQRPLDRLPLDAPAFLVAPDLDHGRVYFIGPDNFGMDIFAYDVNTRQKIGSLRLPQFRDGLGSFCVWNGDQLAFSTGAEIVLVPMSLLQP